LVRRGSLDNDITLSSKILAKKIDIIEKKTWAIPADFVKNKLRDDPESREDVIRQIMNHNGLR